jgi:hypothetical protein
LARFEDKVTRLEVHLADENSDKSESTNDALIEARPVNMQPVQLPIMPILQRKPSWCLRQNQKSVGHGFENRKRIK